MNWVGVDLDGTLAYDDGWKGGEHIGEPIMPILNIVKNWVNQGARVKIFTARAGNPALHPFIHDWLEKNGLPRLEITNVKDSDMTLLLDDRARQVVTNTGVVIEGTYYNAPSTQEPTA